MGFASCDLYRENISKDTYQHGWDAARERLYKSGLLEQNERDYPIKSVIGQIKNVNQNEVTLEIRPVEALADSGLDIRTVILTEQTKIFRYVKKDEEEIDREKQESSEKGEIIEPEIFKKKEMSLSALQISKRIIAKANHDIRNEKEFNATEIIVQE